MQSISRFHWCNQQQTMYRCLDHESVTRGNLIILQQNFVQLLKSPSSANIYMQYILVLVVQLLKIMISISVWCIMSHRIKCDVRAMDAMYAMYERWMRCTRDVRAMDAMCARCTRCTSDGCDVRAINSDVRRYTRLTPIASDRRPMKSGKTRIRLCGPVTCISCIGESVTLYAV